MNDDECDWIPEHVKDRLKIAQKSRITKNNDFVVVCDTHRTQYENKAAALERLEQMIEECCYPERERVEVSLPTEYDEQRKERNRNDKSRRIQKNNMKKRGW